MADETARKTGNKRIRLPSGGTVLFPCLMELTFKDTPSQAQETRVFIDNSPNAHRDVHVDEVPSSTGGSSSGGATLPVERIDRWVGKSMADQAQEFYFYPDNKTGGDSVPPHFSNHFKTSVLRVKNDPDDGGFIDTEVIDEGAFKDIPSQAQESRYFLQNPQGTDDGQGHMVITANSDDKDITDADDGSDSDHPVRTDMWQNIVNWGSLQSIGVTWIMQGNQTQVSIDESVHFCGEIGPAQFPTDGGGQVCAYLSSMTWSISGGPSGYPPGFSFTGTPSVSSLSFGAWENGAWAWLKPIDEGGSVIGFNSSSNHVSGTVSVYGEPLSGSGPGFYYHPPDTSGFYAGAYAVDATAPPPLTATVGSITASLTVGSSASLGATPYECYATNLAFSPLNSWSPNVITPLIVFNAFFRPTTA